jgi:hypothetical protein
MQREGDLVNNISRSTNAGRSAALWPLPQASATRKYRALSIWWERFAVNLRLAVSARLTNVGYQHFPAIAGSYPLCPLPALLGRRQARSERLLRARFQTAAVQQGSVLGFLSAVGGRSAVIAG